MFVAAPIDARGRVREIARGLRAFDDRRIVAVRREHALGRDRMRVADHREQRLGLLDAVDHKVGVEDLVAAVLGVRLREHHQLHVGGVATQPREARGQVVHLVRAQGQAHLAVGTGQGFNLAGHTAQGPRSLAHKQPLGVVQVQQHRLGHAIVQRRAQRAQAGLIQHRLRLEVIFDPALDAAHRAQAADMGDVGGLARPRRGRARTGHHQQQLAWQHGVGLIARPIGQQPPQHLQFALAQWPGHIDQVREAGPHGADARLNAPQLLEEFEETEFRGGGTAGNLEHGLVLQGLRPGSPVGGA